MVLWFRTMKGKKKEAMRKNIQKRLGDISKVQAIEQPVHINKH